MILPLSPPRIQCHPAQRPGISSYSQDEREDQHVHINDPIFATTVDSVDHQVLTLRRQLWKNGASAGATPITHCRRRDGILTGVCPLDAAAAATSRAPSISSERGGAIGGGFHGLVGRHSPSFAVPEQWVHPRPGSAQLRRSGRNLQTAVEATSEWFPKKEAGARDGPVQLRRQRWGGGWLRSPVPWLAARWLRGSPGIIVVVSLLASCRLIHSGSGYTRLRAGREDGPAGRNSGRHPWRSREELA